MTASISYRQSDWRLLFAAILFIFAAFQTYQLVGLLNTSQSNKTDLAEISHIRYGLLNADEWVKRTSAILEKKIDEFELNDHNKAELRQSVNRIIDAAINQIDQIIREKNLKDSDNWWDNITGAFKQIATDFLVDIQGLRSHVPEFTEMLFNELNRPGGKDHIKIFLHQKLSEFAHNTFNPTDMSRVQEVMAKHQCNNVTECHSVILDSMDYLQSQISYNAITALILFSFVFIAAMPRSHEPKLEQLLLMALSCIALLLSGILTPMIEIEAKVSELKFMLLGEPMIFQNQVLYFQSKSITDVVSVLTATGKLDVMMVGVLVALFSIVFPATKIIASVIYYLDIRNLRSNAWVSFFALKSGKWSMADVLVVALFMAYIGFSGMISSQLSHLQTASRYVDVLTTDGTSLQTGFFLFLGFCLASMLLSSVLEKSVPKNSANNAQPNLLTRNNSEKTQ